MHEESPKPPDGLETAGRRLWDSVAASFVLNAGELEILRQAAATVDEIALLEAELRGSSLVVAGFAGQPRPNPLLKIIQDHRLLLRRLVDSLALSDDDLVATCADTWVMFLPPRSETLISFATLVNPTTAALPPSVSARLRSRTERFPIVSRMRS
jgi:hypothetical protein